MGLPSRAEALAAALAAPGGRRATSRRRWGRPARARRWPRNTPAWAPPCRSGADRAHRQLQRVVRAAVQAALPIPGDAVLVPEPSYPLFDYLARLEGVAPAPLPAGLRRRVAHRLVQRRRRRRARGRAWCNPNNPTGSFLRRGDLQRAVGRWRRAHGLALIVDEVFADYAFAPAADAVRHRGGARRCRRSTFALGGLSKSCGLPQMKLGWIAALGPEPLAARGPATAWSWWPTPTSRWARPCCARCPRCWPSAPTSARTSARACAANRGRPGRRPARRRPGQLAARRGRLVGHPARARGAQRRGVGPRPAGRRRRAGAARLLLRSQRPGQHPGPQPARPARGVRARACAAITAQARAARARL